MQAADEVLAGGKLRLRFGVGEGSAEAAEDIGLEVATALHRHSLKVIWDGKAETPILVDMMWRKHRAGGSLSVRRLCVDAPPLGHTWLTDWIGRHKDALGRRYTSEMARRLDRVAEYRSN
jgi:hypothetical protein